MLIILHSEEQQGRHKSDDRGTELGSGNKASLSSSPRPRLHALRSKGRGGAVVVRGSRDATTRAPSFHCPSVVCLSVSVFVYRAREAARGWSGGVVVFN